MHLYNRYLVDNFDSLNTRLLCADVWDCSALVSCQ